MQPPFYLPSLTGYSPQSPIIVRAPQQSLACDQLQAHAGASHASTSTLPVHAHWRPIFPDKTVTLGTFSWPHMWFDVPTLSPVDLSQGTSRLPVHTAPELDCLPELDRMSFYSRVMPSLRLRTNGQCIDSITPDSSPALLHETCTTPCQDAANVAVCNAPLVAPRPLPFTPPTFLQFDSLPDEDEDLSFPPYTHTRRHIRKRHRAEDPIPVPGAAEDSESLSSINFKRRKVSSTHHIEPAVFGDNNTWDHTLNDRDLFILPQFASCRHVNPDGTLVREWV